MDLARPITSVVPGLTGRVLAVLGRTDAPLTGRAITAALRPAGSQAGVAKVLDALVRHGVVLRTNAGTAAQYVLNREHLAAPLVEGLAELRATFLDRLGAAVADLRPAPLSAYLYGSAARGDGDVDSDVDIALVVPDEVRGLDAWDAATAELRRRVETMTGNAASLVEYTTGELCDGDGRWLADVLRREGIRLHGLTLAEVVRRRERLAAGTRAARGRAAALVEAGRYAEAADALRAAVEAYRGTGDRYSEASALGELGDVLARLGRHAESAEAFERAAETLRDAGDAVRESVVLADAARARA
ncbi:MAG TPA: tetratricopeptide repeat protein, partial [Mycobacteriales bacterium]|nr:tetratricopeptide repeat protein [Mycobacteriales bacterium]